MIRSTIGHFQRRLGLLLATLTIALTGTASQAAEIRVGGTGNALGTLRLLADAYMKATPGAKIVLMESIGSSGAIKAVPRGGIEIGLSSRPLTEDETRSGATFVEYARTSTVFAVQAGNKTQAITSEQIADIYSGKLTAWADAAPIRPIMRQPGDDNTKQIRQLSPDIEKALAAAEQRPGLTFATTDQEAANKMESVPGSLGVTTVALIRSEKRALKPLALNGVEPTVENLRAGRYPLVKHFYFILPKEPAQDVRDFLKYVHSAPGRAILEQTGHMIP